MVELLCVQRARLCAACTAVCGCSCLIGSLVAVMSAHCLTFSDNQSFVHMPHEG